MSTKFLATLLKDKLNKQETNLKNIRQKRQEIQVNTQNK
jgi:hypothetical protein